MGLRMPPAWPTLFMIAETTAASGARGLARGEVYRRDGVLVASVVQEGLIRRTDLR